MVSDNQVRGVGGAVGKHVAVQRYSFMDAFVVRACVEESGIGLVRVGRCYGVEQ